MIRPASVVPASEAGDGFTDTVRFNPRSLHAYAWKAFTASSGIMNVAAGNGPITERDVSLGYIHSGHTGQGVFKGLLRKFGGRSVVYRHYPQKLVSALW
jgi:hypothetical protein